MKLLNRLAVGATLAGVIVTGGVSSHSLAHLTDSVGRPPAIPRCINDDYNDGTQARCWTENVRGKVLVIDRKDRVISVSR